jgi:putative phosphoribosyl transferase
MVYVLSRRENIFENRLEAGRLLGRELSNKFRLTENTVVLGVPRGGLVVARGVSGILEAPLDIVLAGKLSAPDEPEFAIGAITADGSFFLDQNIVEWMNINPSYLEEEKKRKLQVLESRKKTYRSIVEKVVLSGKTVVVTDDGLATGASIKAALLCIKRENPKSLVAAIPVGSLSGIERIGEVADEVLCLNAPPSFHAVGEFYRNFEQICDDDVFEILREEKESRSKFAGLSSASAAL